ncbi:hypothetical protein [Algicola sagamiensis]|uniref:hypothetical protein n=1 Tax=Algicola sagamiensis TaxID=163869 RepID=UPI000370FD4F|nr:hypothetical protein [Algicola sagamiensis]
MFQKTTIAVLIGSTLTFPALAQQQKGIEWFGSVYAKFLDGDRRLQNGLYNNLENGSGDQGQGIEFELMFRSQVSKQVEMGGRLKGRFSKNYWSNYGGFGDDENDPVSAQYLKVRGVWVRLTPGYDWLDSATIGSNDWGMFDPFTVGKIRYIDRDNASGIHLQGSALHKTLRWDFARVSLPKLWAGPGFNTGEYHAQDAAWVGQIRWQAMNSLHFTTIIDYVDDHEIDKNDHDVRDGQADLMRYNNFVSGIKSSYYGIDNASISAAFYHSQLDVNENLLFGNCDTIQPCARWSPILSKDSSDNAWKVNIDLDEVFVEDFSISFELFDIGSDYQSIMAARREQDVLATEGFDGTWQWSRPNFNTNVANGAQNAGVGYGGWDGETHQVVAINADNDFTDFDETAAYSVLGWRGLTILPKYEIAEWELAAEFTYIDYSTNWQACGEKSKANCAYPVLDNNHNWGVGGDTRSPYGAYQDRDTQIYVLKASHTFDIGEGIDFKAKYKHINDQDKRVTAQKYLHDAYHGQVAHTNGDDREASYDTYTVSAGYQLHEDLHTRIFIEHYRLDLKDGTVNAKPATAEEWDTQPDAGWLEYATGQHQKTKLGVEMNYFLSGAELGLNAQWIEGTYDPEFYTVDAQGHVTQMHPTGDSVQTALGAISTDEVDFSHYRMKAFVKVKF